MKSTNISSSMIDDHFVHKQNRLFFIDFLKAISIVSVVSFHSIFFPESTYESSVKLLDIIFSPLRFCVPIFLTISCFLLARSFNRYQDNSKQSITRKRLMRLAIPTLFWFGLSSMNFLQGDKTFAEIIKIILTGNVFSGAYYLIIMFQIVILFPWIAGWLYDQKKVFSICLFQLIIFITIYLILQNAFGQEIINTFRFLGRTIIFYWLAYLALGIYFFNNISKYTSFSRRLSTNHKILIILALCLGFILEANYFYSITNGEIVPFEYNMLSCIVSVPILFICFLNITPNRLNSGFVKIINLLSTYSLGIFCINGIVSRFLLMIGKTLGTTLSFEFWQILIIKLIGWLLLLGISLGVSILIKRIGFKSLVC